MTKTEKSNKIDKKEKERRDKSRNSLRISEFYNEYCQNHKKLPRVQDVADALGLHNTTVYNHLKEYDCRSEAGRHPARAAIQAYITEKFKQALAGDPGASKFIESHIFGLTEKTQVEHSGKIDGDRELIIKIVPPPDTKK